MFIKGYPKYNKTTKESYWIYKLCESYRINGNIRHYVILGLGKLESIETLEERYKLSSRIEQLIKGGGNTLAMEEVDPKIEGLAQQFYKEIRIKKRYDIHSKKGDWETVNMSTMKNKDGREIGAEWLCKQAFEQLGIAEFLRRQEWSDEKISLATTHIISRAVYPASELKTVSFIKENSAISELTGFDKDILTKDLLYGISHKLYSIKDKLENYLSKTTNELFDLEDKIILFDLTNTYYEGSMRRSKMAKYGRSKEKRSDAKLVVLAAVINREGFLKYTNIFEGNMADCETLQTIIEALSAKTSFTGRKPIVIIDAGIATEKNLMMLRMKGYDYICVSRSGMKEYYADIESTPVEIKDKRKQSIELLKVKVTEDNDNYLWVKSQVKGVKERSMNGKLSQRFIEGIENINYGITTKGGTKKLEKVSCFRHTQIFSSVPLDFTEINFENGCPDSIFAACL